MAIWICQFVGREIRLLDYIEGIGQPLFLVPTNSYLAFMSAPKHT
jgi:hypothetical protein